MKNKHFSFNLENLSKFRSPLMGISIIMILLCHARMDGANLPDILLSILSLGNYGVDIFLLLSGIGMYYSISNQRDNINWGGWVFKRLRRILIPYLIIESPFWIWYAIHNGLGIEGFLYYISFASYWVEHVGLWFLALLVPLYILTPALFLIFDSRFRYFYLFISLVIVLVASAIPFDNSSETISTIQGCLSRIPCYLVGLCIGKDIQNKRDGLIFLILPLVLYIIMKVLPFPFDIYKGWILALYIVGLITVILEKTNNNFFVKPLAKIGNYTLELYIGLDLSKNILIQFMDLGTSYWISSIIGSVLVAVLFNYLMNSFKKKIV